VGKNGKGRGVSVVIIRQDGKKGYMNKTVEKEGREKRQDTQAGRAEKDYRVGKAPRPRCKDWGGGSRFVEVLRGGELVAPEQRRLIHLQSKTQGLRLGGGAGASGGS